MLFVVLKYACFWRKSHDHLLNVHAESRRLSLSCQMLMLHQLRVLYQLLDSDIMAAAGSLPDISCLCWGCQLVASISFQILMLVLPAEVLLAVKCWCCQSRFSISWCWCWQCTSAVCCWYRASWGFPWSIKNCCQTLMLSAEGPTTVNKVMNQLSAFFQVPTFEDHRLIFCCQSKTL